jgi:hypothetical protein
MAQDVIDYLHPFWRTGMILKYIIMLTVFLLGISAIGLLFFPSEMLTVVGITSNDQMDFLLRASGAGVASLIPGAWAARTSTSSAVSRAVLMGLVVYMILSSVVDMQAYAKSIVNTASIPSIGFRILLGVAIFLLSFKDTSGNKIDHSA